MRLPALVILKTPIGRCRESSHNIIFRNFLHQNTKDQRKKPNRGQCRIFIEESTGEVTKTLHWTKNCWVLHTAVAKRQRFSNICLYNMTVITTTSAVVNRQAISHGEMGIQIWICYGQKDAHETTHCRCVQRVSPTAKSVAHFQEATIFCDFLFLLRLICANLITEICV